MSLFKRMAAVGAGGAAVCAALLAGTAATAQAAPLETAHPAAVAHDAVCGFNEGGLFGVATYNNCSPYSVEIRIEWWFSDDTYRCVPAHSNVWLNNTDDTPPYYAVFDGRTNC